MIERKGGGAPHEDYWNDTDRDGVVDGVERLRYSDPYRRDSDRDGVGDREELKEGTNAWRSFEKSPSVAERREKLREDYFKSAKRVMGWEKFDDVNYNDLYEIVDGNGTIGVELDRLIAERGLLDRLPKEEIEERLTQSVLLQRLIADNRLDGRGLAEYIGEIYEDRVSFIRDKNAVKELIEREEEKEREEMEF
jgi:hypothetical protein